MCLVWGSAAPLPLRRARWSLPLLPVQRIAYGVCPGCGRNTMTSPAPPAPDAPDPSSCPHISEGPGAGTPSGVDGPAFPDWEPRPGSRIGPYRLIQFIDEGGMGSLTHSEA